MVFRILFLSFLLAGIAYSQKGPAFERGAQIVVKAEVVAYDKFSSPYYVAGHAPTRFLIVQISKVIKGSQSGEFVLVANKPSERRYPFVRAVGDGKHWFKMKLRRSKACDSTMQGLVDDKVQVVSQAQARPSAFMWLKQSVSLSPHEVLPCYILDDGDFDILD